jgi:putative oxidoreductase
MKWITLIARLIIGSLFIYASVYKILDPAAFSTSIRNYGLIPTAYSNLTALTLPWLELGAGILLILGIQTRAAALLTSLMMLVFLAVTVYAYTIGLDTDCGCFSSSAQSAGRIGITYILRDSGLAFLSLWILICDRGDFSLASAQKNNQEIKEL